jgi:hypothetical protein
MTGSGAAQLVDTQNLLGPFFQENGLFLLTKGRHTMIEGVGTAANPNQGQPVPAQTQIEGPTDLTALEGKVNPVEDPENGSEELPQDGGSQSQDAHGQERNNGHIVDFLG